MHGQNNIKFARFSLFQWILHLPATSFTFIPSMECYLKDKALVCLFLVRDSPHWAGSPHSRGF